MSFIGRSFLFLLLFLFVNYCGQVWIACTENSDMRQRVGVPAREAGRQNR